MDINYEVPVDKGRAVKFTGTITPEETEFLLQFALVILLQRGMLVSTVAAEPVDYGNFAPTLPKDAN
jgi:hypothetical protein